MNAKQNYSILIDSIFGSGTANYDLGKDSMNPVINALMHTNKFTTNFTHRLNRLKTIYSKELDCLKEIIIQVNEIADDKNWEGAFAELAAYDHLNSGLLKYTDKPIKPNITFPNIKSFSSELGKQETNLDGVIEEYQIYFDVKCLKDNVKDILCGIYNELKTHLKVGNLIITPEYELNISYEDFKKKRTLILNELKAELNIKTKKKYIKSKVIDNLSYRILWEKGLLSTIHTYDPFKHAKDYHRTIFNYTNKFIKDEPTMIVLVVFPWYNLVISDFANSNTHFYRAFSRRIFCQYKNDDSSFKTFNSSFKGNHTIYEISRYLTGIVFLEDNTILSDDPEKTNVKSYVYLNPNALNPLKSYSEKVFLRSLYNNEYETFEYDNY